MSISTPPHDKASTGGGRETERSQHKDLHAWGKDQTRGFGFPQWYILVINDMPRKGRDTNKDPVIQTYMRG